MINKTGFRLIRLSLHGSEVPTATIEFRNGLNVIVGPSDTGKTFIVQCVSFMLGDSDAPDQIDAAKGYDTIQLLVGRYDSENIIELQRSLRGGDFAVKAPGKEELLLKAKHKGGEKDTISAFLLDLCGLSNRELLRNLKPQKRPLSFRDIAHVAVVDEESIIKKSAAPLKGSAYQQTSEWSTFKLILTGQDDAAILGSGENNKKIYARKGKTSLLDELISEIKKEFPANAAGEDINSLRNREQRLETTKRELTSALSIERGAASTLEESRRVHLGNVQRAHSILVAQEELLGRFRLLDRQYQADIQRLEALAEASGKLASLEEVQCPLCGADPEHHRKKADCSGVPIENFAAASQAEIDSLRKRLGDLHATIAERDERRKIALAEKENAVQLLAKVEADLKSNAEPRIHGIINQLQEIQAQLSAAAMARRSLERLNQLEGRLKALEDEASSGETVSLDLDQVAINNFCTVVADTLGAWNWPGDKRVTFNDKKCDIVVSGQDRASHGKGVRAMLHTAFTVSLLQYCRSRSLPHPGFVVIDSPLKVYEQADDNDIALDGRVKHSFWKHLATAFSYDQVIIAENAEEIPPEETHSLINMIRFSGLATGRPGFIPNYVADQTSGDGNDE